MDKRDKLYELHRIFVQARGTLLSKQKLLSKLECSDSTLKRRLNSLRDTYGAPLEYSREKHGWYYQKDVSFELPGLWFNDQELYAFLILEQLLENLDVGLVSEQLSTAKNKIKLLLSTNVDPEETISNKLRLINVFHRIFNETIFKEIAKATFDERQLEIDFINRNTQQKTTRIISPQRIVHYKNTWYLDCYCHLREEFRTFSIDGISNVKHCHRQARIIDPKIIDKNTQSTYGIFSGQAHEIAILHFQNPVSFWIAKEIWHPSQQGQWLENNIYELKIPYQNPKELLADILRYADKVTVKSPESLRQSIKKSAKMLLENHK
jgi:predicted DNA-binding transcriptional regulator YafY